MKLRKIIPFYIACFSEMKYYYYYYYYYYCEFFTPVWTRGLSREFERQQVSSGFQDFSQYSI